MQPNATRSGFPLANEEKKVTSSWASLLKEKKSSSLDLSYIDHGNNIESQKLMIPKELASEGKKEMGKTLWWETLLKISFHSP